MSAPRPGALASIFSLEPGTERQERRGRLRERSDMGERLKREPVSLQPCKSRLWTSTPSLAASIRRCRSIGRPAGGDGAARSYDVRDGDDRALILKLAGGDLDVERAATTCARLRRRGYPAPVSRTDRARRRRRLHPLGTAAGRADTTDDDRARPRRARARDVQRGIGSAEPIPLGSTTWSPASSKAASATASTSRCRTHSDETRALLDRLLRIAGAADDFEVPTDDIVHFDLSHCERAVGRRRGHHGRHRLGGHDDGRRGLRSRHARALHLRAGRARRVARRRPPIAPTRASLPLYAAHMVLRQVDWSLRHHGRLHDPVVARSRDRAVGRGRRWVGSPSMIELPVLHAARARRRRVRLAAAGRRVRREQRGRGRRRRRHHRDRHAHGPRRSGNRSPAAVNGLGRPVRRILLTHAHIDHVGGTRGFPNAGVYGSPQTSQLLDGAMPVAAYKSFMPAFDAEFDELAELGHAARHAPRHRRRVPHAAHRGDAGRRATPRATSSRSSPTPTSSSPATSASSASRRSRSRATRRCGPRCSTRSPSSRRRSCRGTGRSAAPTRCASCRQYLPALRRGHDPARPVGRVAGTRPARRHQHPARAAAGGRPRRDASGDARARSASADAGTVAARRSAELLACRNSTAWSTALSAASAWWVPSAFSSLANAWPVSGTTRSTTSLPSPRSSCSRSRIGVRREEVVVLGEVAEHRRGEARPVGRRVAERRAVERRRGRRPCRPAARR